MLIYKYKEQTTTPTPAAIPVEKEDSMIRYFKTSKAYVKPFTNMELTKDDVLAEIGCIIADNWNEETDGEYEKYAERKEAEMLDATLDALDVGDCIIYGREESNFDDIELSGYGLNRKPVYIKDGIEYDTLDEAIEG